MTLADGASGNERVELHVVHRMAELEDLGRGPSLRLRDAQYFRIRYDPLPFAIGCNARRIRSVSDDRNLRCSEHLYGLSARGCAAGELNPALLIVVHDLETRRVVLVRDADRLRYAVRG